MRRTDKVRGPEHLMALQQFSGLQVWLFPISHRPGLRAAYT